MFICIIIVYISKFPTCKLVLLTSPLFSRIHFVCFALEQYESVKIQLALSIAACFPISVDSFLAFELILLGNQNGLLQKTNNLAWRLKGKRVQIKTTYAWEFANQVEFIVLPAFFFRNLYPSGKYTSKKPAKPQSTKTAHSTGYSMQNKVGPS